MTQEISQLGGEVEVSKEELSNNITEYLRGNTRTLIDMVTGNLFQYGDFTLNSGAKFKWKIECDALTNNDVLSLAEMMSKIVKPFSAVIGVPRGGLKLAKALEPFVTHDLNLPVLIVDDVLTTGGSMERVRKELLKGAESSIGVVVFARGPCPSWIRSVFQMPSELWLPKAAQATTTVPATRGIKTAVDRAMEMMQIPTGRLPPSAIAYAKKLCSEYGGCMEVFITAYAHYAQVVEGLKTDDDLYMCPPSGYEFFKNYKEGEPV